MNTLIARSQRFLDRPLGLGPRGLLLVSAFLIFPGHLGVLRSQTPSASGSWVPFALGVLALLLLRAFVQGKVRDLVHVAVLSVYFTVYLSWSSGPGSVLSLPLVGLVSPRGRPDRGVVRGVRRRDRRHAVGRLSKFRSTVQPWRKP